MSDNYSLIMAVYPAAEGAAETDFDALVRLVADKTVRSEGAILVDHAADGKVTVRQTGDHLGRKGMGWGGGVGLLVGLTAPPLLASIVVGGAAAGLLGRFVKHREKHGFEGSGSRSRRGPPRSLPSSMRVTSPRRSG